MPDNFDVSTSLFNLTGGRLVTEEPPGYATLTPPRKTARGREKDVLFLCLGLRGRDPVPAERYAELLDLAAVTFYGSPGSVTSALRQAIIAVNEKLLEANLAANAPGGAPLQGGLVAAALRGADFYAVQSGPGLLIVARPTGHERFPNSPTRPLGLSNTLDSLYYHCAVAEGDFFAFSHNPPRGWTDIALVGLGQLGSLPAVAERLAETAGVETTALLGCFEAAHGAAALPPARATAPAAPSPAAPTPIPAAPTAPTVTPEPEPAAHARAGAGLADFFRLRRRGQRAHAPAEAATEPTAEVETDTDEEAAPTVAWGGVAAPQPEPAAHASDAARIPDSPSWPAFLRHPDRLRAEAGQAGEAALAASQPGPAAEAAPEAEAAAEPAAPKRLAAAGAQLGAQVRRGLRSLGRAVGVTLAEGIRALRVVIARALPEGTLQKDGMFTVPTSVQVGIAIIIPVLVVGVSVWTYLDNGRNEQYAAVLTQAQWSVARGRAAPDPVAARPEWESALSWLAQAESLRPHQPEVAALRLEAQTRLDELDWVSRLDFQPLLLGGLGRDARIKRILLAGQDVYALEESRNQVYRLTPVPAGTGYTIDEAFQCSGGQAVRDITIGQLVDIALIPGPTVIAGDTVLPAGSTVVLAFDSLGALLYCAPGIEQPYASYLAAPEAGWIRPTALQLYTDRLYILDPGSHEIWQYTASAGAFTQAPGRYFTTESYDLTDVVDFTIAGGEVYLLRRDGRVLHCTRLSAVAPATCAETAYSDPRPGRTGGATLSDVSLPVSLDYDAPPEPSLYLLDGANSAIYQLSLRLDLVGQFRPVFDLPAPITSVALDPAKRFYVSAGDNVYVAGRP